MEGAEIKPFVKFDYFHTEQRKSFKNNPFVTQNLFYNKEKDYFVCPKGQHLEKVGTGTRESESGFISNITYYAAKKCKKCPLKSRCHKGKGNHKIEINENLNRHKEIVRELLSSEEGRYHRSRRPQEPEAVFGQGKSNKATIASDILAKVW